MVTLIAAGFTIAAIPRAGDNPEATSKNTFTVTIEDPTQIHTGMRCTWSASVQGGTGPYQYAWHDNSFYPYDDISFDETITPVGTFPQWITVTDAQQNVAKDTLWINSSYAHDEDPLCYWP
jgi:hypothetical protein